MTLLRRPPALAATALVVGLVLAAAGCGGGSSEPDADSSASGEPSPSTSTTASESPGEAAEPYLPVPAGVRLTPPGSDLELGDRAVVAWEPREDQVGAMTARVDAIEKTSFEESFTGWQLGREVERSTPYFVRVRLVNDGDTDLDGVAVPLFAVDDRDGLVEATSFKGTFEPCPGERLPKTFAAGDKADLCLVYLAAPGRRITGVGFRPTQAFDQITWTGKVTDVGESDDEGDQGDQGDKGDKDDDRGDKDGRPGSN